MKFLLAQATTTVPWEFFPPWLFGLFGALCIGLVALLFIHYFKKVFGRQPPFDDELKKLRSEIYHSKNSLKKELLELIKAERERVTKLEERYEEMQLDRQRKWDELKNEYTEVSNTLAYLRGWIDEQKRRQQ